MNAYSNRGRVLPAAALLLALIAAVAVVASGALGRAGSQGPTPSAPPSGTPKPTPEATPTPTPPAEPSDAPADGIFDVALDTLDEHDVTIVVDDATGTIVKASTGTPDDGMSVRWFDLKVENVDAKTLRLIWVGLPVDEAMQLSVTRNDGKLHLRFVQASPPMYSDAMGYDRNLVVAFDQPVSAGDVTFSFEASLDTSD